MGRRGPGSCRMRVKCGLDGVVRAGRGGAPRAGSTGSAGRWRSAAAARRTLPLGSKARVRNLGNGRSATVTVRDRGPHAPGRILDVSPGTAERLGMKGEGVAAVEVAPVEAPRTGQGAEPRSAAGGGPGRARR